jgi:Xaa-Pro aminopeptidase
MGSMQVAALVCFLPADVLLLTGYWPVMGGTLAVLTSQGALSLLVPEDELELAKAAPDAHLISYKPVSVERLDSAGSVLFSVATKLLRSLHLPGGAVATSMQNRWQPTSYLAGHRFHAEISALLHEVFPDRPVVSGDEMLERLQSVKTGPELQQLGRACSLAAAGFAEASPAIAAGKREDEVAADIGAAFARVAQHGFERGWGYFFCMSGPNSAKASGAYARTRQRVIEGGDLVMVHANTVGDGFWTDITRTFVVGQPSNEQQRMFDAIAEARAAALRSIAPGARASEVDRAARSVLARHGFGSNFKHATGHGVGFAAANPHAHPRIHAESPDILEPGMTFNIEPAIYLDGLQGMRHCDVVACTDSGFELLTPFQAQLHQQI